MNFEHVSVENHQKPRQSYLPGFEESTIFSPPCPDVDQNRKPTEQVQITNPEITRILQRHSDRCLSGYEHFKQYLRDLYRRNCRPSTLRNNGTTIILFLTFFKSLGRQQLEDINRQDVSAFIEYEQDRGMTPNTVSTRLRTVYAFINFLVQNEMLHPDLLNRKMHVKVPDSLPRAIEPEDIQKLLSMIKKPRDRALILTLLRTGMRIGELLNTKLPDLNLKEKYIQIFEAQKSRVGRIVYLSADARSALIKWLKLRNAKNDYLFYGHCNRPLSYEAARCRFNHYVEKAGLSHKDYSLHCLRHTYASELLNAGMPLQCLQELLGHSCIEMTRRYARLTDNTRREQYYKAMAIIERGQTYGHYQLDYQLPQVPEAAQLL
jgi:integrase/recombinase XerD